MESSRAVVYPWRPTRKTKPGGGSGLTLLVPLRDDGGLELVLEVYDCRPTGLGQGAARVLRGGPGTAVAPATPLELRTLYTDFTVDWYGGRPKLQRGFYFLGLTPGVWRSPWDLPGAPEARRRPPHDRYSLVVSFEGVPEHDQRLLAAARS